MNEPNRFTKSERLTQKTHFEQLYKSSNKVHCFPILGFWKRTKESAEEPIRIAFSAPKKHYKKASDRNHIKRLLRETYRTQNHSLKSELQKRQVSIIISVVVLKTDNTSYELIRGQMMLLLQKIEAEIKHAE